MKSRAIPLALSIILAISGPALAAERLLLKKEAERKEIRHSMIGPRDTLLFYTFADQKAVLRLQIGNGDLSFPVSGKLYLFGPKTTAEELAKWLNNQHSDGLFPEVPEPSGTFDLPEGACKVTGRKLQGEERQGPQGLTFQDYKVDLSVEDHSVEGKFEIKGFEDEAGVFVKVTEG